MYDIKEYYDSGDYISGDSESLQDIESDIEKQIDTILKRNPYSLYSIELFKFENFNIEIIFPSVIYTEGKNLVSNPNKIRSLLSFYPEKDDLKKISKIVLRPKYVEINNTELAAIYIRKKRILILYLTHPYFYEINNSKFERYSKFLSIDLHHIMNKKLSDFDKLSNTIIKIPQLWYCITVIDNEESNIIEKFFIKQTNTDGKIFTDLSEISYFYSMQGY
jgi:hypothetical protein